RDDEQPEGQRAPKKHRFAPGIDAEDLRPSQGAGAAERLRHGASVSDRTGLFMGAKSPAALYPANPVTFSISRLRERPWAALLLAFRRTSGLGHNDGMRKI